MVPYGDLPDQSFSQFKENSINNQDPYSQTENDETPEAEYLNENDSEDTETNRTSTVSRFMPQILPDEEIATGINSLNSKQVHSWTQNYVKYDGHDVEAVHIFLSDNGGTGKVI